MDIQTALTLLFNLVSLLFVALILVNEVIRLVIIPNLYLLEVPSSNNSYNQVSDLFEEMFQTS
jgi:hypothetical protein